MRDPYRIRKNRCEIRAIRNVQGNELAERVAALVRCLTGDPIRVLKTAPYSYEIQRWTGSRWVKA